MFSKKVALAKLYNLKSVVDGMITAIDADAVNFNQAMSIIGAFAAKTAEDNSQANQSVGD